MGAWVAWMVCLIQEPQGLTSGPAFLLLSRLRVDMELTPWTQLYHRRPLLTGCTLWPEKSVCTSSAAALLEPCWSSVLLPVFICVHLSLHVAPATTLSVLVSFLKISLLSFWPLGALLLVALDLSDILGVAGKNDAVKCQIKSRWNCMHVWVTPSLLLWI